MIMPKRRALLAAAICLAATTSYANGCLGGGQTTGGTCGKIEGLSLHTGFDTRTDTSLNAWIGQSTYTSHRAGWYHMGGVAFRVQRVERIEDRRTLQMIMVPVQN